MSRKLLFILLITFIFGFQPFYATADEISDIEQAVPVPQAVANNRYYLESLKLTKLAQETYEYGDYDTSAVFAEEAIRYARLSDEFVAAQLKIIETNDAIATAKTRMNWAVSSGAAGRYPNEYGESVIWYRAALLHRSREEWDEAISDANKVIDILAFISPPEGSTLPAQYLVREWATFKDCLWNIAGYPWVYGNPYLWTVLYNANKSKMPDQNNPDWIEPGMILDIPSIRGEVRQGLGNSGR